MARDFGIFANRMDEDRKSEEYIGEEGLEEAVIFGKKGDLINTNFDNTYNNNK